MVEPEKNKVDNKAVLETDADIESPYEETLEEEKVEKKVEPKKEDIDEPEDQSERSRLGRRVKRMEDNISTFQSTILSKLDSIVDRQVPKYEAIQRESSTSSTMEDVPEYISTYDDLRKAYRKLKEEDINEQVGYEKGYFTKLNQLRNDNVDPDFHQEIIDEMMKNFNVKHTGKPDFDADLNYTKAHSALLRKKVGVIKPKVKGERSTSSTNLSVESRETSETEPEPQLDEFAKEFVSKVGMKTDKVKEALKSDRPLQSGKGR